MINLDELKKFKKEAHGAGYESENPKNEVKEGDGSTTLWYESGDWKFHDNYFGGEPYGGRTVISYKNKPVWIMVYYGLLDNKVSDVNEAYVFLRKALRAKKDPPARFAEASARRVGEAGESFRGPKEFSEGKFRYANNWQGAIENYSGKEEIYLHGDLIYTAMYMGGLVDQREGD